MEDSALMECNNFDNVKGKWFMDPAIDDSTHNTGKKINDDVTSEKETPPHYNQG